MYQSIVRDKAAYDTLKHMGISSWQQQLRNSVRDRDEILRTCGIGNTSTPQPDRALVDFPPKAPGAYLQRVVPGNPDDPLLRQVMPVVEEDQEYPGYSHDPTGEFDKHQSPGLVRKYPGRALLITTSVCAIHCRYCFRRHYPYQDNIAAGKDNWENALITLRDDRDIREIILSGGDPLSLSDNKLNILIQALDQIPHLERLRIHTRMPVVLPDRVTPELVLAISQSRMKQTLVVHVNHPGEIDENVTRSLTRLHEAGIQLLNQSVLLKGVNDNAGILAELSERLYASHVLPYYLHMLDPVAGAAHFEVDESMARTIMDSLRACLPGYLVPRLVREIPDATYKSPID